MAPLETTLPDTLRVSIESGVAAVLLYRPDKRNSLDEALIGGMTSLFGELSHRNDVRVVTIEGAGGHFCSGLYLNYLEKISSYGVTENLADSSRFRDMMLAIYRCPKPVIAKVRGYALAGGCGIASACDLIVADTTAQFGYTEVRFGFIPAIVAPFLIRRVGEAVARDLLLTARIISADEARELNFANRVVSPEKLDATVTVVCEQLLKNSASSLALTKELFANIDNTTLENAVDFARHVNAYTRMTDDFKKGLKGFLEKK